MKLIPAHKEILEIVRQSREISISQIQGKLTEEISIPTLNRYLAYLVEHEVLERTGQGRSVRYRLSQGPAVLFEEIGDSYFQKDVDDRKGSTSFKIEIFETLRKAEIFSGEEKQLLESLQKKFSEKVKKISPTLLKKETARLTTEFSWKSSQIEGNTYTLLETELLFADKIPAKGKDKKETAMLLNHKTALEYIYGDRFRFAPLKIATIEGVHSLLVKDLGVSKNLRKRAVGISGTSYRPPDNEFQIREYMEATCGLINARKNVFEKAMLAVLFISYIQPFEDGNKRTGRIVGNAILIDKGCCPLSYRSVSPSDYKKAMILFYEQNNLAAYKKLFLEQYAFAVNNYF